MRYYWLYDFIMTFLAVICLTVLMITALAVTFWPLALMYSFGFNYPLLCAQLFWLVLLSVRG